MQQLFDNLWLWFVCIAIVVLTVLRLIDDESLADRTKGYKIRKIVLGSAGNVIAVISTYHAAVHFGLDVNLSLALGAVIGFIGGEVFFKKFEKAFETWLQRKAEK